MQSKTGVIGSIFKKVPYAAGFTWAKVSKLKKGVNNQSRKKTLFDTNGFFNRVTEWTADLFENAKGSASELKKSFTEGFESNQRQVKGRAGQIEENDSNPQKYKPRSESLVSIKKKSLGLNSDAQENPLPDSRGTEEFVRKLSHDDSDFEREIEEIDKLMAEI